MGNAVQQSELSEILVQSHHGTAFPVSGSENLHVSRVRLPIPDPDDIMTCVTQRLACASPDTRIEQQLHGVASMMKGSTRSWPTNTNPGF